MTYASSRTAASTPLPHQLPHQLPLTEAARLIADRSLSPVELTTSVLDRIAAVDPKAGAYVTVTAEAALHAAAEAEREIAAGHHRGPLHGVPVALKDLIDVAGVPTTASSRVRADHTPDADATVTERLRAAGAVLIGKTHTHEFAYGLTTPQTRNAWSPGHVAGGSSGGSAVAVAAGTATFALGTDTGGSIRVPAALNHVVGLKPTYGLIPRHGVTSLSWSLDHVGPITRTAGDAALVLQALAGYDPRDPASLDHPREDYTRALGTPVTGLRIGVPANYYFDRVQPQVAAAVRAAVDALTALGATAVPVHVPMTEYVHAAQWGHMVPEATAYHQDMLRAAPDLYSDDVRMLLEAGEFFPATDYIRAQRARTLMHRAWLDLFDGTGETGGTGGTGGIDAIVAPAVPATAALADQQTFTWPDGSAEPVSDAYVRLSAPANLTGFPALSLPVGLDDQGLPIGMQLIGRPLAESTLLRLAHAYETAHRPVPAAASM
ncbi:amidase [Streptomyces sp. CB02923]|uniref:Asp-tRNA(Asn)/Glu-tRNA(Gln) amidotransferase GatCAB subunit A n=1 Tax=Streptomyces sp. CB02923 TaxID=1718985 RepID=UPI00093FB3BF|nr:Asp-tRNA(Asn)/Glu-tRNA(Gln) amidotransferase GatCAB subunit A [Streptomyces sp. CB02923]OKI07315.1 amidase [Streptomyces sp. CB02923]